MALRESELKKWKAAAEPISGKSDGGGLTFTLSAAGTASWVFRYRHAGKQRAMTLGNYPDMTLEKAREAARAARIMVDLGKDVAGEKRRAKADAAAARTFREITEGYLAKRTNVAPKSVLEWRRYMKKDVYPKIGNLAIGEVTVNEIRTLVKGIAARSQTVARCAFEMLSVVFAHALGDGLERSPMVGLKVQALVGDPAPRRQRVKLERDEIALLFASAQG